MVFITTICVLCLCELFGFLCFQLALHVVLLPPRIIMLRSWCWQLDGMMQLWNCVICIRFYFLRGFVCVVARLCTSMFSPCSSNSRLIPLIVLSQFVDDIWNKSVNT
jgi:hypothetical protein